VIHKVIKSHRAKGLQKVFLILIFEKFFSKTEKLRIFFFFFWLKLTKSCHDRGPQKKNLSCGLKQLTVFLKS
jgi:hypothetical protein